MNGTSKIILAAAAGLLCAQPLSAQTMQSQTMSMPGSDFGHHMSLMHSDGSPFMMLLKSANLTPAQQTQMRQILQADKGQMHAVGQQLHALHEELAAKLLGTTPVTAADLAPLQQKMFRLQQQLEGNMIDTALSIRNILTPEQIGHLAQVHQKLQSLHQQIQTLMGPRADNMDAPEN